MKNREELIEKRLKNVSKVQRPCLSKKQGPLTSEYFVSCKPCRTKDCTLRNEFIKE